MQGELVVAVCELLAAEFAVELVAKTDAPVEADAAANASEVEVAELRSALEKSTNTVDKLRDEKERLQAERDEIAAEKDKLLQVRESENQAYCLVLVLRF